MARKEKHMMKRILLSVLTVILSLLCLFSCGKDKDGIQENGGESASVESGVENTAQDTDTSASDGGDVSTENEMNENTSKKPEENDADVSAESSVETVNPETSPESKTEDKKEDETGNQTAENKTDEATCTAVWVSTQAFLDGELLNPETDGKMEMQLALFADGEYIMAAYFDGEMLENYPQQAKYILANGHLSLESGWSGNINGDKLDLEYSDGESTVAFRCSLAASGE